MNEDQAQEMIQLLKDIRSTLEGIESNTSDIGWVNIHTEQATKYLKEIRDSV